MRASRQITVVLISGALVAAGCSTSSETSQTKTEEWKAPAQVKTVSFTKDSVDSKALDEKVTAPAPVAAKTGSVSFVDGESAYQAKNFSDAIAIFEQYTVQRPKNVWGHYMLGLSAWKGGDFEKAEKSFNDALNIDPDHFKSLLNLSRAQIEQKHFDDAIENLTHAGEVDPTYVEIHRLMGRAYHSQKKIDEAIASYKHAIELDEKDAWAMNDLGLLLIEQNRGEEAVPLFTKAVELRKDVPVFRGNLKAAVKQTKRSATPTNTADAPTTR